MAQLVESMEYMDKQVLMKREEKKRQTYHSIEQGMNINGQVMEFERYRIVDKFSICLPNTWKHMPHELQAEDVKKMAERVMETIASDNSEHRFFKFDELEKINGCWFTFRSHTMDSDLFNQMLIAPINHTIMMANFNCLYEECSQWDMAVLQMWESIQELKEESRK